MGAQSPCREPGAGVPALRVATPCLQAPGAPGWALRPPHSYIPGAACVHVCVYVCLRVCPCVLLCTCVHACACVHVRTCVHLRAWVPVCPCVQLVCMCIRAVLVCRCVCVRARVYLRSSYPSPFVPHAVLVASCVLASVGPALGPQPLTELVVRVPPSAGPFTGPEGPRGGILQTKEPPPAGRCFTVCAMPLHTLVCALPSHRGTVSAQAGLNPETHHPCFPCKAPPAKCAPISQVLPKMRDVRGETACAGGALPAVLRERVSWGGPHPLGLRDSLSSPGRGSPGVSPRADTLACHVAPSSCVSPVRDGDGDVGSRLGIPTERAARSRGSRGSAVPGEGAGESPGGSGSLPSPPARPPSPPGQPHTASCLAGASRRHGTCRLHGSAEGPLCPAHRVWGHRGLCG